MVAMGALRDPSHMVQKEEVTDPGPTATPALSILARDARQPPTTLARLTHKPRESSASRNPGPPVPPQGSHMTSHQPSHLSRGP